MKRVISIVIAAFLLPGLLPAVAQAAGEITILSPGVQASAELTEFAVACSGAEAIFFELDGEKIGETAGETTLTLAENSLTAGNHTLKVSAVFPDKTAAQDTRDFYVSKRINVQTAAQDFDGYVTGSEAGVGISHVDQASANGGAPLSVVEAVTGKSGRDDDKALHMKMIVDKHVSSGAPYFTYGSFKNYGSGLVTVEYDIKLDDPEKARVRMEDMHQWQDSFALVYDGVFGGTDRSVSEDWMHVKVVVDYAAQNAALTVDDDETPTASGWGAYSYMKDSRLRMTLLQNGTRTEATRSGFTIDNLVCRQDYVYGLSAIAWRDAEGVWTEYTDVLPAKAEALKIRVTENLASASVTKDTVLLYQNGAQIPVSEVVYDDVEKAVIVTPDSPFCKGAEVVVKLSDAITLKGGSAVNAVLEACMHTENPELTPKKITFSKNGSLLISGAQLAAGDVVAAEVELNNDTDSQKTMAAIVCVRQNGKLRAIGAAEETLAAGSSLPVTITLPAIKALDAQGAVSVRLLICDGLGTSVPYMAYTEIQ